MAVKEQRISLYYFIEDIANQKPDAEALWARAGSYTWKQLLDRTNQYAQWFLSQGVRPGDLVGFMMINSTDFIMAWIGLWAVGAAPAMVNYNLMGAALVHTLNVSTAKLVLVSGGPDIVARIEAVLPDVAGKFKIVNLEDVRDEIYNLEPKRPGDELRKDVNPTSPMTLFYTRCVLLFNWVFCVLPLTVKGSGTTGTPKGCVFPVVAAFAHAVGVRSVLRPFVSRTRTEPCESGNQE